MKISQRKQLSTEEKKQTKKKLIIIKIYKMSLTKSQRRFEPEINQIEFIQI